MRRLLAAGSLAAACLLLLVACGGGEIVNPAPETVVGKLPKAELPPATAAFKLKGDPGAGAKIFQSAGCVSCHTLAAAKSTGTVGPNLDQAKPDYRLATARVTLGKGGMPPFKGNLSDQQIADVAAYVVKSTGGSPP